MDLCVFEMPDATMHQVDLAACEDVECLAEGVIPAVAGSQESPANPSAAEDPAFQSEECQGSPGLEKVACKPGSSKQSRSSAHTPTQQSIRASHQSSPQVRMYSLCQPSEAIMFLTSKNV